MMSIADDCRRLFLLVALSLLLVSDLAVSLTITSPNGVLQVNQTFAVICRGTNAAPVQWVGPKGKKLGIKTRPKVQDNTFGTALYFERVQKEDAGIYTCKQPGDGKSQQFSLVVDAGNDRDEYTNYFPHPTRHTTKYFISTSASNSDDEENVIRFLDTPEIQDAKEGAESATLRCEVSGAERSWSVDGVNPEGPKYQSLGDGLLIRNITKDDSYHNYTCTAVQRNTGQTENRFITLRVLHEPRLPPHYEQQEEVFGFVGGTVDLVCEVEAEPPPVFSWFVKNNEMKKHIGKINETQHKSVLTLKVRERSFGDYSCNAANNLGTLTKRFTLMEGTQPNPPTRFELAAENSEILSFYVEGPNVTKEEIENKMEPRAYRLEYRTAEEENENEESSWDFQEFDITTDEPTYSLQGLQHNTKYEVRAATRNLAGLSQFTNSTFAKTLESSGDSVVVNLPSSFRVLFSFSIAIAFLIHCSCLA